MKKFFVDCINDNIKTNGKSILCLNKITVEVLSAGRQTTKSRRIFTCPRHNQCCQRISRGQRGKLGGRGEGGTVRGGGAPGGEGEPRREGGKHQGKGHVYIIFPECD